MMGGANRDKGDPEDAPAEGENLRSHYLRKVMNLRAHYEYKGATKRFHNLRDWEAHREWMMDGERWFRRKMN